MVNILVVFPKLENAKNIKNLLVRSGYSVTAVCTTGHQALAYADGLTSGIIVTAYKLPDMLFSEIKADLPDTFSFVLLASRNHLMDVGSDVIMMEMPLKIEDFVSCIEDLCYTIERQKKKKKSQPTQRDLVEKDQIVAAKLLLMEHTHRTEEEAYRYLQKTSMDSGTNMVETAQKILAMFQK